MEQHQNEPKENTSEKWFVKRRKDILFILLIFIAVVAFYAKAIFGNGFDSSDSASYLSFKTFLDAAKSDGTFPQWLPNVFCGLPNFASLLVAGERSWDFIDQIYLFGGNLFKALCNGNDIARVAFNYFIYGVGMFWLARTKKMSHLVAFIVAFASMFSTFIAGWIMIGHFTKIAALMSFPYAFIALESLRKKIQPGYIFLLFLSIYAIAHSFHVQMFFYLICAFAIYFIYMLIAGFVKKEEKPLKILLVALILAGSGGVAYLTLSDSYLSTFEYTPYSTRGSGPLVQKAEGLKQDASGGNDYEYATNWSFSPEEVKTFFVPNYYGFGKMEFKGPATSNRAVMIHSYWGQMPFTDAANYMGAFILLVAIIGVIVNRKSKFVQFLTIIGLFGLLLSFGKNLSFLYDIFYYYVPSFNKFRAPSIALVLLQFAVPILAGYGFKSIYNWRENWNDESKKYLTGLVGFSGIFLVFGFLYSGLFKEGYLKAVAESATGKQLPEEIHTFIYNSMINDWYITALIALLASLVIYAFAKNKIKEIAFGAVIIILLAFDLWRVDYRMMEIPKKTALQTHFPKLDYVEQVKKIENNKNYNSRIVDFTSNTHNGMTYYGLQTPNGYHSAKLRVYQDLMDNADNGSTSVITNPFLWNLMNVKYIVFDKEIGLPAIMRSNTGAILFANPAALPRVFFVKNAVVAKNTDILKRLKDGDFNPIDTAFVESSINKEISAGDSLDNVEITNYKNELIELKTSTKSYRLMFMSEVYYPVGWKAYIDGQETEIYKTNFAFRSIVVPAGEHKVEFKYHSPKFELGKTLSFATNIIVSLIAVGFLALFIIKKRKES